MKMKLNGIINTSEFKSNYLSKVRSKEFEEVDSQHSENIQVQHSGEVVREIEDKDNEQERTDTSSRTATNDNIHVKKWSCCKTSDKNKLMSA